MKKKVIIALSGGVDSSVAAYLLQQRGYEVIGVTLDIGQGAGKIKQVQAICQKLAIPFHRVNAQALFKKKVINSFIAAYQYGCTPNPCVVCNYFVKFNYLLKIIKKEFRANTLATGHYARIKKDHQDQYHLYQAKNKTKDQSYFLYMLDQTMVSRILFPLGDVESKEEVRKIAKKLQLPSAETEESQDICFVKENNLEQFFKKQTVKLIPGNIRKTTGEIVEQHRGIVLYTIGQRRGIRVADCKPLYVVDLDSTKNEVIVGYEHELYQKQCLVKNVHFISNKARKQTFTCKMKVRYKTQPVTATVTMVQKNQALVTFSQPVRAITPGQVAVFYQNEEVLGGGVLVRENTVKLG